MPNGSAACISTWQAGFRRPTKRSSSSTDASADKRAQLVDALLESPETARNFATSWTNLLVGRGRESGARSRRPAPVSAGRSSPRNHPWSETVTALITAEGPAHDNGPANFLLAHLNNEAVPATAVTARCFLGLQVQCTQCHAPSLLQGMGAGTVLGTEQLLPADEGRADSRRPTAARCRWS